MGKRPLVSRRQTVHPHSQPENTGSRSTLRLLAVTTFVVILNETIMINAIPRLMDSMRITESAAQWVSTTFMLAMAAVIPITGWFLRRVTTRQAYSLAMSVFLMGTAISAAAPAFGVLLLGRVTQAAGTAIMMPLLMTTLMAVVPERFRGRVMGNVTMAIAVAPALGPAAAGAILQFGSWRMLFIVVLLIAGVITWFGLRKLENTGETANGSVDWLSVVVAAAGFSGLVYGLRQFGQGGAGAGTGLSFIAGGLVLIASFAARQLHLQGDGTPLMDLRVLKHRTYRLGLLLLGVVFMTMLSEMILVPLYLQNVRNLTALQTGLLVMPGGLAVALLGPVFGKLFDHFGARPLIVPAATAMVTTLAWYTQLTMTTPYWMILGLHALLMISLAAIFTPVFTLSLGALPESLYSHGSSMLSTLEQIAAAFGIALVIAIMSARAGQLTGEGVDEHVSLLNGLHWAFTVGAAIAVTAVVVTWLLPSRAPVTRHQRARAD